TRPRPAASRMRGRENRRPRNAATNLSRRRRKVRPSRFASLPRRWSISRRMLESMSVQAAITSVADTALWMAAVRAAEGKRADAAFQDPLGSILAGDRGRKIARSFSRTAMIAWGVVLRTSAIDRLILEALQSGVDTVLNLGAGLDTRPYRMDLPAQLRWIEVDLPALVETKNTTLKGYTPVCGLERIGMDLSDVTARGELFARVAATCKKALVITEGFIS